jgi:hypothetical protein
MRGTAIPHTIILGTCLLTLTLAARTSDSRFEAHATGARTLTLRGNAEYGPVRGTQGTGPFVITLGASSSTGAVLFTLHDGGRPKPGIYPLSDDPSKGVQALVVTGSPSRATGAYRAQGGTLTVTRSDSSHLEGRFTIDAMGFDAASSENEEQELTVFGKFSAAAGSRGATPLMPADVELPS